LRTFVPVKDILLSIFLLSSFFLLHSPNLNSWFIADDPQIVYSSQKPVLELFFDKETYYFYNTFFYAPLHPLYYKMDFLFFQLKPFGYHVLNVMALFLVSVILYKVFSFYIEKPYAFLGTVIFSVLPSSTFDAAWITTRHYLMGLFFYLVSLWFFRRWEDNKKYLFIGSALLSGMCAFLSKELFVSLPAVIIILARGGFTSRVKKAVPFMAMLLGYLLWRTYMLEGPGGYPDGFSGAWDVLLNIFALFPNVSEITLSFSILSLSIVVLFFIRPMLSIIIAALFFVTIAPLVPVLPSGPVTHPVFIRGLLLPAVPIIYGFIHVVKFLAENRNRMVQLTAVPMVIVLLLLQIFESRRTIDYLKGVADETEKAYLQIKKSENPAIIVRKEDDFLNLPVQYFYFLRKINEEYLAVHFPPVTCLDNTIIEGFVPSYIEPRVFDEAYTYRNGLLEREDVEKLVNQKKHFSQNCALPAPEAQINVSGYHMKVAINKQCNGKGRNIFCINLYGDTTGCFYLPDEFKVTLPPQHYLATIFYRCSGKTSFPFMYSFEIKG
jgi:hypothetical protein